MSDDKKSDDYRIDMPSGKEFRAPSPLPRASSSSRSSSATSITENPIAAILAYCGSSILMTVTNKYVLSGVDFNLNFFLLCVQVCVYRSSYTA
jgi:GDP-mannose transporter